MYFYLTQLLIPAAYLYQAPWSQLLIGLGLLALFGLCYAIAFPPARPKQRLLASAGMVVLMWVMMWLFAPEYVALAYYPVAVLSFMELNIVVPAYVAMGIGTVGLYLLYTRVHHIALSGYLLPVAIGGMFSAFIMAFMLRYYGRLQDANERLANANAEIERLTKVAERERISRDLHDVMGHQLSMISLKAQVVAKVLQRDGDKQRAIAEVSDIERAAREALARVREYVADMRQADFGEEWIAAETLLNTAGIDANMDAGCPGAWRGQPFSVLAMCLREAVTNVVRHSGASRCTVRVWREGAYVHLLVADNGRGLRRASAVTDRAEPSGSGLQSMRARVEAIQGSFAFWTRGDSVDPVATGAVSVGAIDPQTLGFAPGLALLITLPDDDGHLRQEEMVR